MAISIFPSTAAEFVSNNFVVDMNDTSNNTADTGGVKQAGPYSISLSSGDSSFDVYLVDEDGNSVGYSNNTSIVASGLFSTVVILGVAQDEVVSFLYQGSVNNADGEGDEPGAGAYLESITPSDLPSIDDTATVIGGNFGADTEIKFESGATVLDAKNITVNNSTELIVTRPDNLNPDLDPWTLRAITTGVPQPTGTNANILTDAVTSGAVPSWVTTSPLTSATINTSYSETLEATDADGAVTYSITTGSLPTGLSLDSSTGVISGTPTAGGQTFTVTASDDGGNQATREFTLSVIQATGGTVTEADGFVYHTFSSTDDFEALAEITTAEYLVIAGGGGGRNTKGGGGAGGLLNNAVTIPAGIHTATIGAGGVGGNTPTSGTDSSFGSIVTTIGGGRGGDARSSGFSGGSGGGAGVNDDNTLVSGGSGTAGQGFDGGSVQSTSLSLPSGGGGGAGGPGDDGEPNANGNGGIGLQFSDYASATSTGSGTGFYAGGGGSDDGSNGTGADAAGGGGQGTETGSGQNGLIIVRYQ